MDIPKLPNISFFPKSAGDILPVRTWDYPYYLTRGAEEGIRKKVWITL